MPGRNGLFCEPYKPLPPVRYDPEKQEFSPVTSATVSLERENTQVYFFDPNRETPLLITNGDPLSFESLGVLFYTPKDWAKSKWEQIKNDVSKLSGVKVQEALKLAEQENYLGAYSSGTEALKQPKKVLYDEAHDSAYSLTWEGASKINPEDPFARAMRTYRAFLDDRFDLQIKTSGQLTPEELSNYSLVIIDTPKSFTPAETAALGQYIEKGGRVLLFPNNDGTQSINDFLSGYGIKYDLYVYIKKTKDYIDWPANFMVSDFKVFALDPVCLSGSSPLRVNTPSIALGATDADVYIDKNYNDAMDTNEEKGPFTILAAYKNKGSGGMLIVYADHSQQDYILDVRGTLGIQLALLDLAVNG